MKVVLIFACFVGVTLSEELKPTEEPLPYTHYSYLYRTDVKNFGSPDQIVEVSSYYGVSKSETEDYDRIYGVSYNIDKDGLHLLNNGLQNAVNRKVRSPIGTDAIISLTGGGLGK